MEHSEIVGEEPAKRDSASSASTVAELQPIPVLLYHSVEDAPAPDQPLFTVRPSTFAEHVAAIVDSGRSALTKPSDSETRIEIARIPEGTIPLASPPAGETRDNTRSASNGS